MKIFVNSLLMLLLCASAQAAITRANKSYDARYSFARTNLQNASATQRDPVEILRSARTIYIAPNKHVDAKYLEYKLGKLPQFEQWNLSVTRESAQADLVLEVHRRALNYIFSIIEPRSGIVIVTGKVVAINGLVAAQDISREIIRRMEKLRALPASK